jgi:ATP-binding cassette subfamily B multidrug efflux pump
MSKEQQDLEYKAIDFKLLKRLLVFLKPYNKYVFIASVLALLNSSLGPLRPYFTKMAIDNNIAKNDWDGLLMMTLLIFGLIIVSGLFQFALNYIMQTVGQKVLLDIRVKLYDHIQRLSLKYYDKNPVGRLVTRVTNDIEGLNELFSSGVVMIVADILLIIWIIVFMFYTSVELAIITLSILPLIIITSIVFRKKVRKVFRDIRLNVSKMNSFLNEYFTGIVTIKLFSQEEKQFSNFQEVNEENKDLWVKSVFYYAVFFPIVELLSAVSLGVILWYTAGNILSEKMTVGILVAFLQYAEMFFRPIRDLTEKYTTLQSAMASSERIFNTLDTESEIIDKSDAKEKMSFKDKIEFKNVSFEYEEDKAVLKNVTFEVNKGETIAIVGATGSGKSTIISLLSRFYEVEKGEILIDGENIKDLKQESLHNLIALVMQDVFLFSRDISKNISLGNEKLSEERIKEAAIALGAYDFIENLSNGFNEEVKERGATLSAGQRQLISFCRAFAYNPDILILDEATSNIDSESEKIIENSLELLFKGRTSLVIAHRLSTIQRADRIIVLHHGEIKEIGNHKELMEKNGIYARLYNLQFKKSA